MSSERREFFRIEDNVIFDVHPVDAATAANLTAADVPIEGPSWAALEAMHNIDQRLQASFSQVAIEQPQVAKALSIMQEKIDFIARHSVLSSYQHLPQTRISLSEDAIAFKSPRAFYKGSYVLIRMIFLPLFTPVITFAQIIRCESRENSYNVAAKFHRLDGHMQQVLAKRLIKAQQQA